MRNWRMNLHLEMRKFSLIRHSYDVENLRFSGMKETRVGEVSSFGSFHSLSSNMGSISHLALLPS